MQRMPPTPEGLARRLLADETWEHQSVEGLARAAERINGQQRERLPVFLGPHDFDSLWARAMLLIGDTLPPVEIEHGIAPYSPLPMVQFPLCARNLSEDYDELMTTYANFIALFFTFIGAHLGLRLICQVWPQLSLDEADTQTGEATVE